VVEVKSTTWEEFSQGELVKRVVAEIGPNTLLIVLGEMTQKEWASHDFYKESEYEELLRELQATGNWGWIKQLQRFKDSLACAEEPTGYIVFWRGKEVADIIALVMFSEEHYVNLVVYRLGGGE
jgi:hypothetical protein